MNLEFRLLTAEEIECRIAQCTKKGISILLYKDARCDQNILDETVGPTNWQRHHTRDNANCIVSIWDDEKRQWIEKEDTGTESYTEKEKGLASDSFKRACFNWGIGRELYTAPFMWVMSQNLATLEEDKGRWVCRDTFTVIEIEYINKKIVYVKIRNNKTNKFLEFGTPAKETQKQQETEKAIIDAAHLNTLKAAITKKGVAEAEVLNRYKLDNLDAMTFGIWYRAMKVLEQMKDVE